MQRINHNNKMGLFEAALLDLPVDAKDNTPRGLPNRTQFKHTLFAPALANAHASSVFPFARDALERKDWALAATQIKKTAEALDRAGTLLGQGQ
ncbi:hypothetical protein OPT61_g8705 [Boeremia exigua]|uniref:Uncharacterized protein n=1 Tax=Boeremia exigua TaxID=749465 RepID=A0ACC2HXL1_9PLEO|nr:hypothetical protein OPT61_g8705 [Boeremia exigua]